MKFDYFTKKSPRRGTLEGSKEISYWQLIHLQSRANGCSYQFDKLPQVRWQWPTGTWLQERLAQNTGMPCLRHDDDLYAAA